MLDTFGVLVHTLRVGRCCLTSTIYSTLLHGAFWKNVECVCGDDVEENADFENAKKGSLDHKKIFNALCITKLFLFGAVLKKMCFLCFRNVNVNK